MGWWKQDDEGNSFAMESDLIWGDGPADVLDPALESIFAQFQEARGRKPTEAELKAGLMFSARRLLNEPEEVPA